MCKQHEHFSLPPHPGPVVTYKKVSNGYNLPKATQVLVDGVPTYEIQRVSKYYAGFVAVDINADGTCGNDFVCGGDDVLLREVKDTLEGMVLQSYNEALNDTTSEVYTEANNRHYDAMAGLTSRIDNVDRDTIVTSIDGDELPGLLNDTFQTIFNAGMNTPLRPPPSTSSATWPTWSSKPSRCSRKRRKPCRPSVPVPPSSEPSPKPEPPFESVSLPQTPQSP